MLTALLIAIPASIIVVWTGDCVQTYILYRKINKLYEKQRQGV